MSPCNLLIGILFSICGAQAFGATFVWDAKKVDFQKITPRAIFTNNVIVTAINDQSHGGQALTAIALDGKKELSIIKNDFVRIEAAYPNSQNASVVLVSDNCAGTICHWQNLTMLVTNGEFIKAYHLNSPTKITLTITNGQVVSGKAENIPDGQNQFGDAITKTLNFTSGVGFVATGFKNEYTKLVGEHPEKFFANEALRKPLVNAAGLDTFRDLRQAIGVASPSVLIDGRYIVMQGCVPHNCAGNYSFVMIDAVKSDFYWARFNPEHSYFGGTNNIAKSRMQAILESDEIFHYDDVRLIVTPSGQVAYEANHP